MVHNSVRLHSTGVYVEHVEHVFFMYQSAHLLYFCIAFSIMMVMMKNHN